MNTILVTRRKKLAATVAGLAAGALMLTGCGGGDDTPGGASDGGGETGDVGAYQEAGSGYKYLRVDGDTVQMINPNGDSLLAAIEDIESGDIPEDPEDAEYELTIGTVNDAGDTVIWQDGDDDPISIADDMVEVDHEVFIDFDAEQSVAEREEAIAEESEED